MCFDWPFDLWEDSNTRNKRNSPQGIDSFKSLKTSTIQLTPDIWWSLSFMVTMVSTFFAIFPCISYFSKLPARGNTKNINTANTCDSPTHEEKWHVYEVPLSRLCFWTNPMRNCALWLTQRKLLRVPEEVDIISSISHLFPITLLSVMF